MKTRDAAFWIKRLDLRPHPEGGHYRETYRSAGRIDSCCRDQSSSGARAYSTAIYYLLQAGDFSAFHRLAADEIWHHYQGGQVVIHMLSPNGDLESARLGTGGGPREAPQVVIPAGTWFAATLAKETPYGLVGCTVSPGFDFEDFELARRSRLSERFPQHADLIRRFTR